jgi:glycosyltransferase involved in cell wall biosynthesis
VCVPDGKETIRELVEAPSFRYLDFEDARNGRLERPTLVHAWTPREFVRRLTQRLAARDRSPYVVHLEDNEELVREQWLASMSRPRRLALKGLGRLEGLVDPRRAPGFLTEAAGVTVVVERLLELKPPAVPGEVISPGFEADLFHPQAADPALRVELGIEQDERVLVYPGNAHVLNAEELRALYAAVGLLNRDGPRTRLVRLGQDDVDFLGDEHGELERHVVRVPYRPRRALPRYLALADVLVQPGGPDDYNAYRFPAKLPEFLAMGKPVVLPATNVGLELRDGENCLLLHSGTPQETAAAVRRLFDDAELRERLGRGARAFAVERLAWPETARRLLRFYERVLAGDRAVREPSASLI